MKTIALCLFTAIIAGSTAHAQLHLGAASSASVKSAASVHTPAIRSTVHGTTSSVKATSAQTVNATKNVAGKTLTTAGNTNVSAGASGSSSVKVNNGIQAGGNGSASANANSTAATKTVSNAAGQAKETAGNVKDEVKSTTLKTVKTAEGVKANTAVSQSTDITAKTNAKAVKQ